MLGEVLSYQEYQFVEPVEVGNLPAIGGKETVDNGDKTHILEVLYRPPERRFATPRLTTNLGFLRVHLTIIGPESYEPKSNLTLSWAESQRAFQELADQVETLKKELW